jgi:hypothetical protein
MKKLLSVLSVFALAAIAAGTASAGSISTPTGLNPGDQFRFVFVTANTSDATSSDLSTYDNIVSSDATGYTYGGISPIWKAIVSSATIDAKDHIGLQSSSVVPLYTVNGTKVSGGNLWSGALLNPVNDMIDGNTSNVNVWTGTDATTGEGGNGVGTPNALVGFSGITNTGWCADDNIVTDSLASLYGISEVLTVPSAVPEPSTVMLVGLGGLAALGYSFKRKRN